MSSVEPTLIAAMLVGRYVGAMARAIVTVCLAALVCAGATATARAGGPTTQDVTITGAGGVQLACQFTLPAGTAPGGGWPGIVLFPGLGGTAPSTDGTAFAGVGLASVMCAERGTGSSGGSFDLAGPNDAADAQAIFAWLAARPEVSDTQIGGYGEDLGGAEVWDAAVAGVPFKAIVPADTWSSLATVLRPTGAVNTAALTLFTAEGPATWNTPSGIAARNYRAHLHALAVPSLLFHDRGDFLWDLSQATTAYRLLTGPKRLYIGSDGSLPPTSEVEAWFQHYLAGGPKVAGGVVIQHDTGASTTRFLKLPPTRVVAVNLPGGALKRTVWLPGGPLETFGIGSVTLRYTGASWKQVIAQVSTPHGPLVTEGAVPVTKSTGVLTIPLLNEMALLPRGKRLIVRLTSHDTEFGGVAGGKIAVGLVTLKFSVLQRAVSH
jgi:hypothetical protein